MRCAVHVVRRCACHLFFRRISCTWPALGKLIALSACSLSHDRCSCLVVFVISCMRRMFLQRWTCCVVLVLSCDCVCVCVFSFSCPSVFLSNESALSSALAYGIGLVASSFLLSSILVAFLTSCVGPRCMQSSTRSLVLSFSRGIVCACSCPLAQCCSCRYAFVLPCMRLVSSATIQVSSWPLTFLSRYLNVLLSSCLSSCLSSAPTALPSLQL